MRNGIDIAGLAVGKWRGILSALGVEPKYLLNRHMPCPICKAGKDRYRFSDHEGRGMWICSHCGAGDGFKLLMELNGWDFRTAVERVRAVVGSVEAAANTAKPFDQRAECRRLWQQSVPITPDSAAGRYLNRRIGLTVFPSCLRYVDRLRYEEDGKPTSWHPGMVALVRDAQGRAASIHRTYLTEDGHKAAVGSPKKLVRGKLPKGAAIRLGEPSGGALGAAEGIETALAAAKRFGVTVWSTISADGMANWIPPESVTHARIFSDADESFTGQWAAYACARLIRNKRPGARIDVEIPPIMGTDWADCL